MATRVSHPLQGGARLSWLSTLFERCDNEAPPLNVALIEPVAQPALAREVSWDDWDDAVLHQDRRMGVLS